MEIAEGRGRPIKYEKPGDPVKKIHDDYRQIYSEILEYKGILAEYDPEGRHFKVYYEKEDITLDLFHAEKFLRFYINKNKTQEWYDLFKQLDPDAAESWSGSLTHWILHKVKDPESISMDTLFEIADDCTVHWSPSFIPEKYIFAEGKEARKPLPASHEPTKEQIDELVELKLGVRFPHGARPPTEEEREAIYQNTLDEATKDGVDFPELQRRIAEMYEKVEKVEGWMEYIESTLSFLKASDALEPKAGIQFINNFLDALSQGKLKLASQMVVRIQGIKKQVKSGDSNLPAKKGFLLQQAVGKLLLADF